jgi:hypothetical protein
MTSLRRTDRTLILLAFLLVLVGSLSAGLTVSMHVGTLDSISGQPRLLEEPSPADLQRQIAGLKEDIKELRLDLTINGRAQSTGLQDLALLRGRVDLIEKLVMAFITAVVGNFVLSAITLSRVSRR